MQNYQRIVLGGTFDHFHVGHAALLTAALNQAQTISLGITLPILYRHKPLMKEIQPYEIRERAVKEFLQEKHALDRVTITPIHDLYGTTLRDTAIDAIVVTPATESNAKLVNQKRIEEHMPSLPVIVVQLVSGDDGKIISSERIRRGEIDRAGASYRQFFLAKNSYHLPMKLREPLQKPFGKIITDSKSLSSVLEEKHIVAVGDIVSLTLLKERITPALCIIDYMTERREIEQEAVQGYFPSSDTPLKNPPGTITKEIIQRYDEALTTHQKTSLTQTIVVAGEEDLLALPVMLVSPLGSVVLYGLHDVGIVVVTITETLKAKVKQLLTQF